MTNYLVAARVIRSGIELRNAIKRLDAIIDAPVGSQEADERAALSNLISVYEDRHYPIASLGPVRLLRCLMKLHKLSKSSLPEIGPQSVVTLVLLGRRTINFRMAIALGKRFRLNPKAFRE